MRTHAVRWRALRQSNVRLEPEQRTTFAWPTQSAKQFVRAQHGETPTGIGRLYALAFETGRPAIDFNSTSSLDSSRTLGAGIPTLRKRNAPGFLRDDTSIITSDEMGLSLAYKTLRESGRRVAFTPACSSRARCQLFMVNRSADAQLVHRCARPAIRLFVEGGGDAVLAPEESVIPPREKHEQSLWMAIQYEGGVRTLLAA